MTTADYRDLRDFQKVRLNKVTHLPYPRKYKVVRVTKESIKKLFFDIEERLPFLGGRLLPEPLRPPGSSEPALHSEMIKRTTQTPAKCFNEIRQSVRDLTGSGDQCRRNFNIKISTKPTQLKGRLRGKHVYRAASLTRWTLLHLSRFAQRASLDNFVKLLVRTGNELGMRIEQPGKVPYIEMIIIVLAKNTNYAEIKQVAETEMGLRTQCVMDNNVVKKCNLVLVTNLCQKINTKLGGTKNSLLSQENRRSRPSSRSPS
ncbi:hypothetical protein MRX96_006816 [Rhipicephalus microplus]